jgi:hypothetical protein
MEMVIDYFDRWKKSLVHKYFQKDKLTGIEKQYIPPSGSPIWKLFQASLPLIQIKFTWIPLNEKNIKIWDDIVLNIIPLSHDGSLKHIKDWLEIH